MLRPSNPPPVPRAPSAFWRSRDLRSAGYSRRGIGRAVQSGQLVVLRRGSYCEPSTDADSMAAARLGGRLTCVSELARLKVFVLDRETPGVHVHLPATASRIPSSKGGPHRHWKSLERTPRERSLSVDIIDALIHAFECQTPRAAVASVDSAVHLRLLRPYDLDELFDALPRRYRRMRGLVDGRAESGPETFMRLILRAIGCRIEPQAVIPGVGRVDFLVDGWLIIECDSQAHHSSWESQKKDRRRDQQAAALGYATLRPIAEDIMWHADEVRSAVVGLLTSIRR